MMTDLTAASHRLQGIDLEVRRKGRGRASWICTEAAARFSGILLINVADSLPGDQ